MTKISPQEMLAGIALLALSFLAFALTVEIVPKENHDYLLIILGALGGAAGVTGGGKVLSSVTSTGPDAQIAAASPSPKQETT
jgi:hypothetical protein